MWCLTRRGRRRDDRICILCVRCPCPQNCFLYITDNTISCCSAWGFLFRFIDRQTVNDHRSTQHARIVWPQLLNKMIFHDWKVNFLRIIENNTTATTPKKGRKIKKIKTTKKSFRFDCYNCFAITIAIERLWNHHVSTHQIQFVPSIRKMIIENERNESKSKWQSQRNCESPT